MRAYNTLGVTAVYESHAIDFGMIAAYQRLRAENPLTVRVLCCPEAQPYGLPWTAVPDDDQFAERLEQAAGMVQRSDDLLRVNGVTIGRGGPCGPRLILMRDTYRDPYGAATTGGSFVTRRRTKRAMRFARERRLRLNIVTAGTAETDDHLCDLERLATDRALAADDRAWLLQHLYFVEPTQARRMADLGLEATTSMSFSWGKGELVRQRIGDGMLGAPHPPAPPPGRRPARRMRHRLGTEERLLTPRAGDRADLRSKRSAGPNPRRGTPGGVGDVDTEAAHVLRWRGIGALEPGHHADLCIVDRDPLRCPLDQLPGTRVHATVLAGRVVHGTL
jgi:predicted amidohydrolase YtcJ